jgi:hypothetical protein
MNLPPKESIGAIVPFNEMQYFPEFCPHQNEPSTWKLPRRQPGNSRGVTLTMIARLALDKGGSDLDACAWSSWCLLVGDIGTLEAGN